jgi:hypothetical protein
VSRDSKPPNLILVLPTRVEFEVDLVSCKPSTLKTYLGSRKLARHAKKKKVLGEVDGLHCAVGVRNQDELLVRSEVFMKDLIDFVA